MRVTTNGCELATWERGVSGPPVLFVHGYPDTHQVWDPVIDRMADRFRCLAYDVRGAGESSAPVDRSGYRLSVLRRDLVAVIDALSPKEPVHLVGHDWGSTQAWDAVIREPRQGASSRPNDDSEHARRRIASFTSISGPCLQHVAAFIRSARRAGWGRSGLAQKKAFIAQASRWWYFYAFQVPRLPEALVRRRSERLQRTRPYFGATLPDDAVNGLELYRANIFGAERTTQSARTEIPVGLVVPLRDSYVTPAVTRNVSRFATRLTRVEIDAGHWVMRSHPDVLAAQIANFVVAHRTR